MELVHQKFTLKNQHTCNCVHLPSSQKSMRALTVTEPSSHGVKQSATALLGHQRQKNNDKRMIYLDGLHSAGFSAALAQTMRNPRRRSAVPPAMDEVESRGIELQFELSVASEVDGIGELEPVKDDHRACRVLFFFRSERRGILFGWECNL